MPTVAERMQESVKAVATHVYQNPPKVDPKSHIADIIFEGELRELAFYENLMTKYGGDPMDLPWNTAVT